MAQPRQATSPLKWYIALAIAIVVSAGAGLVAGMQLNKTSGTSAMSGYGMQAGMQRGFGGARGDFGTVTAVSSSSITIQQPSRPRSQSSSSSQGQTKTYTMTADTKVTNGDSSAAASDIKIGDTVRVETSSSDNTTASTVELNPQIRGGHGTMNTSNSGQADEPSDTSQE